MWELDHKEGWMPKESILLNCDAGLWRLLKVPWTARRANQSILEETNPEYSFEGLKLKVKLNTLATWCEKSTHWKRSWCGESLRAGVEGDDRGWDGRIASLTQWTWVWANSRRWWRAGRPGVLQSMGSQRVGHNWGIELNWCFWNLKHSKWMRKSHLRTM